MKNLLVMFLMAFALVSCEGPVGPPGQDGSVYWWGDNYEVKSGHWLEAHDETGKLYYYYEFKINQLTEDIYYDGQVICYMYLDYHTNKEAKTAMPNKIQRKDTKGNTWEEQYTYEYTPDGFVIFIVKYGDKEPTLLPLSTFFRINLNY